jgi:HAE1 family hydrophobic/amphiphilic exporter-1
MSDRLRDAAERIRANPAVKSVVASIGGGPSPAINTGRMFVELKPLGERPKMPQVVESLRKDVAGVPGWRSTSRRCRTCASAGVRARAATSTRCRA